MKVDFLTWPILRRVDDRGVDQSGGDLIDQIPAHRRERKGAISRSGASRQPKHNSEFVHPARVRVAPAASPELRSPGCSRIATRALMVVWPQFSWQTARAKLARVTISRNALPSSVLTLSCSKKLHSSGNKIQLLLVFDDETVAR